MYISEFGYEELKYNERAQIENSLLYPWVILFYLSKFYELLDSIFLVLMKKPGFLSKSAAPPFLLCGIMTMIVFSAFHWGVASLYRSSVYVGRILL